MPGFIKPGLATGIAFSGSGLTLLYGVQYKLCVTQYQGLRMTDRIDSMGLELRRGVLALAVLSVLRQEHYGYSLRKLLGDAGLDIEEGTLYPLVRRLESHGLLQSRWAEVEGRKRRYYLISTTGEATLEALQAEWQTLNHAINRLSEETP